MSKVNRIRQFELMQYEEFWHPDKAIEWLNKINCSYLAVKHDKDVLPNGNNKKLHYHIYVKMNDARTLTDISKQCEIEKQYIQKIRSFKNACAYAFHLTEDAVAEGKYPYTEDVVFSFRDVSIEDIFKINVSYKEEKKHREDMQNLLFKYGNCEITKKDVLNGFTAEDYDYFATSFKRMKEFRIMKVRDRQMDVIYITGESGTGKTTLAKYFARIKNYDYFVSGSGKDVLDGYDKEECIILDDLRGDAFTKAELFKLTDNNTNSSVKSRYQNKDISFCKLMIITSIKAPHYLYNWFEDTEESFKQFQRRLNYTYVSIQNDGIVLHCSYSPLGSEITKNVAPFTMQGVFSLLGIEKIIGSSALDTIFEKVADATKNKITQYEQKEELPF